VKGKLAKKAKAMLAEFQCTGGDIVFHEYSHTCVDMTFTRSGKSLRLALTIDDAVKQGLALNSKGQVKDMWRKFPRRMLFARVVSEGVGVLAPGITTGIYTPEEVADFTAEEVALSAEADYVPSGAETFPPLTHSIDTKQTTQSDDVEVCLLDGDYFGKRWESLDSNILQIALTSPQLTESQKIHINKILEIREGATDGNPTSSK
jgi:hypothetical protein